MIDLAPGTPIDRRSRIAGVGPRRLYRRGRVLPRGIDPAAIAAFLAPIVPVAELAATPRDAAFHAEGDVWPHTQMAIQALVEGAAYAALAPLARRIVALAVQLHDIGKPATTRTTAAS